MKKMFGMAPELYTQLPEGGFVFIVTLKARGEYTQPKIFTILSGSDRAKVIQRVSEAVIEVLEAEEVYNMMVKEVNVDERRAMREYARASAQRLRGGLDVQPAPPPTLRVAQQKLG